MSAILDRHPGSREYLAHARIAGGTRQQLCDGLAAKYAIPAPTTRAMTTWLNKDDALVQMIRDLERIKAEMSPGDSTLPELPRQVDKAKVDEDIFGMCEDHPAWAALLFRENGDGHHQAAPETDYYGNVINAPVEDDPAADPMADALAVLSAEHDTDEAFEADAISRLTDAERADIAHMLEPA